MLSKEWGRADDIMPSVLGNWERVRSIREATAVIPISPTGMPRK